MKSPVKGLIRMFRVAPPLELKKLEALFRHKVFRILLAGGKISKEMIAMLSTWRHSGLKLSTARCGECVRYRTHSTIYATNHKREICKAGG
jgi:hypothetical protein